VTGEPTDDRRHVLVVRLDSEGDVLLAGPAIRAVAAHPSVTVSLLCGPRGRQAAGLLPGVDRTVVWSCPWIDPEPAPVTPAGVEHIVNHLAHLMLDEALVLTSFHQSPLPTALLLRMAGVPRVVAISDDYPGSLLDVRHRVPDDLPEAERALSLATAAGYPLPPGDGGGLAVLPPPDVADLVGAGPYLVVHPGVSVPARAWPAERCAEAVRTLSDAGHRVLVTGGPDERSLTAYVSGAAGIDLGGRTSFAQLAGVLAGAAAVVVGNTGPAHLAAAVGTPVVSLFAPVVPAARWAPYRVRRVLLGDQDAPCAGTRARTCPVPGHPCLTSVTAAEVVAAVESLVAAGAAAQSGAT